MRERYKGHWIITNGLNGAIWIEVDGFKIASCATVADAKKQIDILVDP